MRKCNVKMSTYKQCFSNDTIFCQIYFKNEQQLQKLCQEGKTYIVVDCSVVTSDSANLQTRSVDYLIFRKSRTKLDDGYDVFAQSVVTTDKYCVISVQMTNLVVVAVVKSKAPYCLRPRPQ